ncbi:MAG: hypothetical protein ACRDH9_11560 [Actinomycetota bacterium]
MPDASTPIDPSRQTPQQASDPIPIPEADARSRKARTVRIQDILAAHARALDVRLDEGMREMRLAMEAAIRRSDIREVPEAAPAPPPQAQAPPPMPVAPPAPAPAPAPLSPDVAKGLAQQTDERFQALAMRLQRIEDAVRSVAPGETAGLAGKIDALTDGIDRMSDTEGDLYERFVDAQRDALEDLTRRVGIGVAAVIRAMQTELTATITRLELTADASMAVAPDEAARLERTMMAIAERQEAVLDGRLAELRESIGAVPPTDEALVEETTEEAQPAREAEVSKDKEEPLDEKASAEKREAEREAAITTFEDEAWPWPEPDGTEEREPVAKDERATEAPATGDPLAEESVDGRLSEAAEVEPLEQSPATDELVDDEAADAEASVEELPAPKKKRRRRRNKKAAATERETEGETEGETES